MSGFITALQLLTSLPLPIKADSGDKSLVGSVVYFPLVGLVIAVIISLLFWASSMFLPGSVLAAFIIILSYLLTGGMHADGFIDTADGLFSGKPRDMVLEIMRDSQVGAMGVISFLCLVLLKFSLLCSFDTEILPVALIVSMVWSRWAMAAGIVVYPYARKGRGLGKVFADNVGKKSLFLATVMAVTVVLAFTRYYVYNSVFPAVVFMLVAMVATLVVTTYFNKKLGGLTGDTYGALNEIIELVMFLTVFIISQ